MNSIVRLCAAVLTIAVSTPVVSAQTGATGEVAPVGAVAATSTSPPPATALAKGVIPKLTPAELEIDEPLGSKISKSGQTFAFHLRSPIVVDGREVVPAGTTGQGEVVHAKKGGGSGAPGELVLAARYLDVGGRRLLLRSLHLSSSGTDRIASVHRLAIASAVSPVPVALLGYFITGGETTIAKGAIAAAKTAVDFDVTLSGAVLPVEAMPTP